MAFRACSQCTNIGTPGWITKDEKLIKCQCRINHDHNLLLEQRISNTGVKTSYRDYRIESYIYKTEKGKKNIAIIQRIIHQIDSFIKNRSQLYIYGLHNTQKTSVVSYLAREISMKDIPVYYTTMSKIVDTLIKASDYMNTEISQAALSLKGRMEETDLLIVDDAFDLSKLYFSGKSNYKVTLLDSFLAYRNESGGANIFVSNIPKNTINLDTFGTSLIEMLQVNCIDMTFEDKLNEEEMRSSLLKILTKQEI